MADGTTQVNELRSKFLRFFEQKQHLAYPSAPLKSSDPGLLFNVAGMQQFKPYFQGATPRFPGYGVWHRVATSQKCMRAGGKDSDIENVGRTRRHHTFFEMLGNFSFGDYFKKEASLWAWEFLTSEEWLGLDPERLYVTVFTDDDEAYDIWANVVGVPRERISRFGESENFWPANAIKDDRQGPCGPCSEIFYDRGPEFGTPDETGPNTGSGDRFMEIWNLVFTQYDLNDGVLTPLPQQNIDTGMGLERLATVVSGAKDAYATELFMPVIRRLVEASGRPYEDVKSVQHRIIADHVRAVTFCIADGVPPANDGAGYVIKMLIRRASRQAFLLGLNEPVLYELAGAVVEAMQEPYPELVEARERIQGAIRAEEEQFLRTLGSGIERVGSLLSELEGDVLGGDVAFDLWQTYGFPLDLTVEMAAERGVKVDRAGYDAAREEARRLSRGDGSKQLFGAGAGALGQIAERVDETEFVGYDALDGEATVVALVSAEDEDVPELTDGSQGSVILDRTPFYPEGGGQIGDTGKFAWENGGAVVTGTSRTPQGLVRHRVRVVRGPLNVGRTVRANVDPVRLQTQKHHTATHLLHAALRSVLGTHVTQAGSLVAPDRLRFDFSHSAAVTAEQVARVEQMVNSWLQQDLPVSWQVVPIEAARKAGAMMLFGEKYGDEVRMVSIGAGAPVSVELCGGTHVARTGEIGLLVVTAEEAVSAGVRRVEARVGNAALEYLQELRATQRSLVEHLGGTAATLEERLLKLQADLKEAQRQSAQLRDKLAAAQTANTGAATELKEAGGFRYATAQLDGLDATALRNAADRLLERSGADVVVVGSGSLLVAKTSEAARQRGAHAGNLARAAAAAGGGGGGGRPDMAQAGVKDEAGLRQALAAVEAALAGVPGS
ncbi:MAG: alanine--tRNA ligase [Trueperaceae bacterium]